MSKKIIAHRIANRQSLATKVIVLAAVHTAPTDKKVKKTKGLLKE